MSTVKLDTKTFNQYVKVNVEGLKARVERTDDLMINLFKAYQVAFNGELVRYIKTNKDQFDDGYNLSLDKITTSALEIFDILRKEKKVEFHVPQEKADHSPGLCSGETQGRKPKALQEFQVLNYRKRQRQRKRQGPG